tara:strand:- start:341 stop:502 length:162 start_codon:yes stop_codon:yes gene_type:complete
MLRACEGSFLRSALAKLKENNVVVLSDSFEILFVLIKKTKQRLDFRKGFSHTM